MKTKADKIMLSYFLIFIAKLVEVSLATIRTVLNSRGEKVKGALIGFFEVMIWVIAVDQVLKGLSENPMKLIIYCIAFSCGNFLGVTIEGKLAIGMACIQAIVNEERKEALTCALREKGFGITTIKGEGKNGPVDLLIVYMKRKCVKEATELIYEFSPKSLVVVNDVRQLSNGYIKPKAGSITLKK